MSYNIETRSAKHLVVKGSGVIKITKVYYEFPLEGEFENELEFEGKFEDELDFVGYYDG